LGVILLSAYLLYLWYKYKDRPYELPEIEEDKCSFCGTEEKEKIFCEECTGRLVFKYIAIFLGIFCIPVGTLLGGISGAIALVIVYNIFAFGYFMIYHSDRLHYGFLNIDIDPEGMNFSFRQLLREISLLLMQIRGNSKKMEEK